METPDTFTLLPLHLDPQTKAISQTSGRNPALDEELQQLNSLHRGLLELPNNIPPPPLPVNAKRSAAITKLRESGNAAIKKSQWQEAIRLYTLGLTMALQRPGWEPAGLMREEVSFLYSNRAQAHMAAGMWAEGSVDAETSVELKKVGNAKGWWRRAKCLLEMGRLEDAQSWLREAVEFENGEVDLVAMKKEVDEKLEKRRG